MPTPRCYYIRQVSAYIVPRAYTSSKSRDTGPCLREDIVY